ncbi:hypothetical protein SNE40_001525 [Patella caerulea]|uniref:BEN domain-containing protein n=1 Tax=Patella caerulea TaxID=87958 RepID=A0AAN8JSZ2_PATCE
MAPSCIIFWNEESNWSRITISSIKDPVKKYGEIYAVGDLVKATFGGKLYPGVILGIAENKTSLLEIEENIMRLQLEYDLTCLTAEELIIKLKLKDEDRQMQLPTNTTTTSSSTPKKTKQLPINTTTATTKKKQVINDDRQMQLPTNTTSSTPKKPKQLPINTTTATTKKKQVINDETITEQVAQDKIAMKSQRLKENKMRRVQASATKEIIIQDIDNCLIAMETDSDTSSEISLSGEPAVNSKGHPMVAKKHPRKTFSSTCSSCVEKTKIIEQLKEKLQEREVPTKFCRPRPGHVNPDEAIKYGMVELVDKQQIYLHKEQLVRAMTKVQKSGTTAARYLLMVFFTKQELSNGTTNEQNKNSFLLDKQIVKCIVDFCILHSENRQGMIIKAIVSKLTYNRCKANKKNKAAHVIQ